MKAYDQQIVIDLEFTNTPRDIRKQGLRDEIIEIGAVRLNAAGETVDTFRCFVNPRLSGSVSRKVSNLTGIRTSDVEDAELLSDALDRFAAWIGEGRTRIVAWSENDRRQIRTECAFKDIQVPAQLSKWLDLQVVYPRLLGVGRQGRRMALRTAADWYGVEVNCEEAHRALYDAMVTAELMRQVMTGEYLHQKQVLDAVMPQRQQEAKSEPSVLSASLGAICSGLEELRRSLELQQCCGPLALSA